MDGVERPEQAEPGAHREPAGTRGRRRRLLLLLLLALQSLLVSLCLGGFLYSRWTTDLQIWKAPNVLAKLNSTFLASTDPVILTFEEISGEGIQLTNGTTFVFPCSGFYLLHLQVKTTSKEVLGTANVTVHGGHQKTFFSLEVANRSYVHSEIVELEDKEELRLSLRSEKVNLPPKLEEVFVRVLYLSKQEDCA